MPERNELHPAWKIAAGLAILFFVIVAIGGLAIARLSTTVKTIEQEQINAEESSTINRVLNCSDIINDEEIMLTIECTNSRVIVYYPPDLCAKIPNAPDTCGRLVQLYQEP